MTDVEPDTTEGKIVDIIIAIRALAIAGTASLRYVGGMSVISQLVESAEKAVQKFKKAHGRRRRGDLREARLRAGSETAALANRVAALEAAVRSATRHAREDPRQVMTERASSTRTPRVAVELRRLAFRRRADRRPSSVVR